MDIKTSNIKTVGKLGSRVYYYRDGELVSRAYVIPVQPGTSAQKAWWKVFRDAVKAWHALTDAVRAVWNKKAIPYRISGYNLYISRTLKGTL